MALMKKYTALRGTKCDTALAAYTKGGEDFTGFLNVCDNRNMYMSAEFAKQSVALNFLQEVLRIFGKAAYIYK